MAFNLFDFSSALNPLGNVSTPPQALPTMGGATGWWPKPPTPSSQPLPYAPVVKKPVQATPAPTFMEKVVNNIVPKANADLFSWTSYEETGDIFANTSYSKEQPTQEAIVNKPKETIGMTTPISGIGAGFVNPLVEISKFSERYLEPTNWFKSKEEVDKSVAKVEKQLSWLLQEEGAKDMPWFSFGKFAWEMAALSAMPTTAINGAIAKLTEMYWPRLVPKAVISILKNNPVKLKAAQSFLGGIAPAVGYQAASEGDVSLWKTAAFAALNPIANIAKSLPWVRSITGKSDILNAGKIANKQALMTPSGKIISDKDTLDAAARRIAGGSPEQAQKTIDAISKIDVKWVNNGDKLFSTLQWRVEKMSGIQDRVLGFDKKLYKPENTAIVSVFKDEVRKVNPFTNALDDLSAPSVMEKLKADDAVKVQYYTKKFVKEGLSKLEQNELARIYGRQFDTFKWATPIPSKAWFLNTQQWMKEVIRRDMTPISKKIDKQISDAIATRDVVKEINNKVAEAKSKITTRLGEQIGRIATNILDKSTFGVLRGITRTLWGSGEVKEGVMTAVEISKQLSKDLATVKKISKLLDTATTKEQVMNIINSFKWTLPIVVWWTITNK